MPDHDHDLIAALAEGRLEPQRAAEAERAIAADPEAVTALAAQRRALAAIRAADPVALTEAERSHLHARVSEAVGLDRSPQTEPARRRAPWAAISIAAATLAALVAVVPLAGILTDDSRDSTAVSLGMAEVEDATRSAPDDASEESADGSGVAGAESDEIVEPVSTTAAAGTTASDTAAADTVRSEVLEERLVGLITASEETNGADLSPTSETVCAREAADHIGVPVEDLFFAELTLDDRQTVVFFTMAEGELAVAAAFSPDECLIVDSLP